jgi:excisionase family DNA binding protein
MTTAAEPDFLTVHEAATYLRISTTKAYQLVASGEIPTVRVGGQYRVPRAALVRRLAATMRPQA